jgi:hypothetical protein
VTQVTRFGGVIPILTSGAVGYDPAEVAVSEDVPEPVNVALDTTGSVAEVPVFAGGSIALVQDKSVLSANTNPTVVATFDDTPTPGNLLIAVFTVRDFAVPTILTTGWTQIESTLHPTGTGAGFQQVYYRIAGSSEPTSVEFEGHNNKRLYIAEFSGGITLDTSTPLDNQTNSGTETIGPITPTAGIAALLIAAFVASSDHAYTEGSGYTLLDTGEVANTEQPESLVEYKIIATTSGSYSATASNSSVNQWGSVFAAFVASFDFIWVLAPNTIDANDATYDATPTATGDDSIWRIQLANPAKIAHVVAKIGANASGAQSTDLYGATLPDFSDEALIATRAWTATGSYTSNTIELLPAGSTAYQYYRLTGPDDVRIYTVEMYPPQVVTNVDVSGFELKTEGGQSTIMAHGSMGTTETFDPGDGNVHTGTLDDDCTFTLNPPSGTGACILELYLSQDSDGGHVITWPGSVTVVGTLDLTADTTSVVLAQTLDSGTSWLAMVAGGSGSSITEILDIPTAETDATLVLAPDGAGGVEFRAEAGDPNAELNIEGGQSVIFAHGSMGSAETFDPSDGNVHTGTLDDDCTFTLSAPSGSGACTLELWLTEDATGGRTVTWPGGVTEQGTHDTTLNTTSRVIVESIDGGTSWVATWIGAATISYATPAIVLGTAAAAGAATTVIRSDSTIAAFDATVPVTQAFGDSAATGSAAVAARRDHKHGMPATPSGGGGTIVIASSHSTPLVFGDLTQTTAGDDLIYTS